MPENLNILFLPLSTYGLSRNWIKCAAPGNNSEPRAEMTAAKGPEGKCNFSRRFPVNPVNECPRGTGQELRLPGHLDKPCQRLWGCKMQSGMVSPVLGNIQGGWTNKNQKSTKEKKKTLEDKRREKPNHTAVRGNKKHVRMKTTSMYVNICHPQQYDLQNKGDGLPAA